MTVGDLLELRDKKLCEVEELMDEIHNGQKKTRVFCLEMTPEEYAHMARIANKENVSKAFVLRLGLSLMIEEE